MACNKLMKTAQKEMRQKLLAATAGIPGVRNYHVKGKTFGRARRLGNGIIEYPKKGYEPPPDIDGFERDPGNPWRFLPKWPKCKGRMQNMQLKSCGAVELLTVCNHPESEHRRSTVTFAICSACPIVQLCESASSTKCGTSGSSNETPDASGSDTVTPLTLPEKKS